MQLVILDAPEDAAMNPHLLADMAHAVNVCAALKACPANVPALIPSGTEGDELEAAQQFEQALEKGARRRAVASGQGPVVSGQWPVAKASTQPPVASCQSRDASSQCCGDIS